MIYISHGVVPNWQAERISHALFHPEWLFALHLQNRPQKYVSLAEALAGEGDALTIDDATHGGLHAALLALQCGHAVSWFVNGMHVERRLAYFPFQISQMVDDTHRTDCQFEGRTWELRTALERRDFRQHLKHRYMRMGTGEHIRHLVEQISDCLEVDASASEWGLRTVTSEELTAAAAAGVDLQNHGWSHLNPLSLSEPARDVEAVMNEEYLSQFRRAGIRVYAPAFGRNVSLTARVSDFVLLADRSLSATRRFGKTINRSDLRLNEFATAIPLEQTPSSLRPAG